MSTDNELITSSTLLRGLRDTGDAVRWARFQETYGRFIKNIFKRLAYKRSNLQDHMFEDVVQDHMFEDVVQETMIALMKQFPTFEYDREKGSFRGYLRGIIGNKVKTLLRKYTKNRNLTVSSEMVDIVLETRVIECPPASS